MFMKCTSKFLCLTFGLQFTVGQSDWAGVARRGFGTGHFGDKLIESVGLQFHYGQVAVAGSCHAFEFLHGHVKEPHYKQAYGQPVCDQDAVMGKTVS